MKNNFLSIASSSILLAALVFPGCTRKEAELGSAENPIKLHFVPSVDAKVIEDSSAKFKSYLEANTPYKYEITIPQSFIAVVEAFGTKRADVAAINTFGYALAHKKYGAEARLTVIRHGADTYQSQFIVKAGSPIKSIADLANKKVAFVEPASMSGYILPQKTLNDQKIKLKETVFAGKHDNVVSMVYNGQVDAGATFYSPPTKDEKGVDTMEDARRLVLTQYPDVEKKVIILSLSASIKNDPIIFRKGLSDEMKDKIVNAMISFVDTADGKAAYKAVYGVTEVKKSTDADYSEVREMLDSKDLAEMMQKK